MLPFPHSWNRSAFALVLGVVANGAAQAQDVVTFRAGLSMAHDDNFYRAPASTAVSEDVSTQSLGLRVVVPYSLQRFELDVGVVNNLYKSNSNFDYLGKNYSATWFWSYTPQLHGTLSSMRAETLNAATDSVNPNQRNQNTAQTTALAGEYEMGGSLRLLGGYSNTESVNEQALVGQADNRSNAYTTGARYVLASGSSIGYGFQRSIGTSSSGYMQTTHDLNGVWQAGGSTSLTGRLAKTEQHFSSAPQFDFSGVFGALNVTWRLSGKTNLVMGWQRDLASFQSATTTYTQTDSFSAGPAWQINAKTALRLQHRLAVRSELGSPTGGASSGRQDRLRDTSLSYSWLPRPLATVATSFTHSERSSSAAGMDYTARLVSLSAQFSF